MNNIILITKNHHLYETLAKLSIPFYTLETPEDFHVVEDHKNALFFDFTLFNTKDKEALLRLIPKEKSVVCDFTCSWGELLSQKYSQVIGSMATGFYSPKSTFEIQSGDQKVLKTIESLLKEIEHDSVAVVSPGHGFIMPRTVSMIINEAYFSLEDELASDKDIDTAMQFGVNYPLGPIVWAHKTGLTPIKLLLDDLYETTHDKRYKLSTKLRLLESQRS